MNHSITGTLVRIGSDAISEHGDKDPKCHIKIANTVVSLPTCVNEARKMSSFIYQTITVEIDDQGDAVLVNENRKLPETNGIIP